MLSDVGNQVARRFGIVFQLGAGIVGLYRQFGHALEDANGPGGKRELLVPATFPIDGNGALRLAHVDVDYTRRLDPEDAIKTLMELNDRNQLETNQS